MVLMITKGNDNEINENWTPLEFYKELSFKAAVFTTRLEHIHNL